jgi:hypothetical protein
MKLDNDPKKCMPFLHLRMLEAGLSSILSPLYHFWHFPVSMSLFVYSSFVFYRSTRQKNSCCHSQKEKKIV